MQVTDKPGGDPLKMEGLNFSVKDAMKMGKQQLQQENVLIKLHLYVGLLLITTICNTINLSSELWMLLCYKYKIQPLRTV